MFQVLSFVPKLTLVTADAPHTVGFDVKFQRTATSEVTLSMAAKYDQSSVGEAGVALRIETEQDPVVDISGVVEPEEVPECHGLKINVVARTSLLGDYDIHTKMCRSGFIELATHNRSRGYVYTTRFGHQTPNSVEASVSVYDRDQQEEHDIIMARAKVTPGIFIEVEESYEKEAFQMLQVMYQHAVSILLYIVTFIYKSPPVISGYITDKQYNQDHHFINGKTLDNNIQ